MYDEDIIMNEGLERIIKSLCADYSRRATIIQCKNAPFNVIMEYRFLNYRIMDAAIEIAGPRDAREFIRDIGEEIGYASTDLWLLPENEYKKRKKQIKNNIAKRLSLM
jgi:hypothetical protein